MTQLKIYFNSDAYDEIDVNGDEANKAVLALESGTRWAIFEAYGRTYRINTNQVLYWTTHEAPAEYPTEDDLNLEPPF